MSNIKTKLLSAGFVLFAFLPCICKGDSARLGVTVISVEQTDFSVLKKISEENGHVKVEGKSVPQEQKEGITTRFYGEIGAYPRFFRIEKNPQKNASLMVRIFYSDLHFKDVDKVNDFGQKIIERNYTLSLNLTVENPEKEVLLCRNLDFEYSLKKEKKDQFPSDVAIFRKMMTSCLRRAAQLMAEKFTVRYKITVMGPNGKKGFPSDEVEIFLDGNPVFNDAVTQCVKGRHEVRIQAPAGYASQNITIDLEKDSHTVFKLPSLKERGK